MKLYAPNQWPEWVDFVATILLASAIAVLSIRNLPASEVPFPTIHVWTQDNCPACSRAKRELKEAGIVHEHSGDIDDQPRGLRHRAKMFPVIWWRAGGRVRYVCGWYGVEDLRKRVSKTQGVR